MSLENYDKFGNYIDAMKENFSLLPNQVTDEINSSIIPRIKEQTVIEGSTYLTGTFVSTEVTLAEERINSLFKKYVFIGSYQDALTETPGAGGSISRFLILTRLRSAGVDCTLSSVRTDVSSGGTFRTSVRDFETTMAVQLSAIVTQDVIWGITDGNTTLPVNAALVTHHFAFIVEDGDLYASNGDGSQTKTQITGITLTDLNVYRIEYDASTGITKFYVNDVLEVTHTTDGSGATDPSFLFGINAIAGTKDLKITNNYMIIHS